MTMRTLTSLPNGGVRRRQCGLTLVELMIAVAISLFVMLAFVSVFINMKRAFTSQDQLSQLQDNERLALSMITSTVQGAGYFPDPLTATASDATNLGAIASNSSHAAMIDGQSVVGTSGTSPASDTLTTRHVAGPKVGTVVDDVADCFGVRNTGATKKKVVNTFSVNSSNELVCTVDGGASTAVVSNVQSLSVRYLVKDALGNAQYLAASAVTDWSLVVSVRITLTFLNPYDSTSGGVVWTQIINLMNRTST